MGLFGRRRETPVAPVVPAPVPATPAERVAAVNAALLERGLGGAAGQGRPLLAADAFTQVLDVLRHFLPDAAERRALCRQLADDLQSMIVVGAAEREEILDVLGVTPARLSEHGIPGRDWRTGRALADDALRLARDVRLGEGELLDRWAADDTFVLEMLAVLVVVVTRLAI